MKGTYVGKNRMLIFPVWGGLLYSFADDVSLTPQLVGSGVFDVALTNYILLNVKPGHKVIDVGANIGYFTVLMGLLVGEQGKVLAYEAGRKNYGLLRDNVAMNMLFAKKRVTALQKAISDTPGSKTFYYSELYTGSSSLVKPGEQYFDYFANDVMQEEEVVTEKLDANEGNFDYIDFIKMDIEGGEYHAFLGMEALLERQAVGKVAFELNPLMLSGHWDEFHRLLGTYRERFAARFYKITNEGLTVKASLDELFAHGETETVLMSVARQE